MAECAHLVAMAKRAEAAEAERDHYRRLYERDEAAPRQLINALARVAELEKQLMKARAEVKRLRGALEELDLEHRDLAMRSGLGFSCEIRDLVDAALATATEPASTPRSALCHHQDRPHCAGCPDDATCEASGREPRGTP